MKIGMAIAIIALLASVAIYMGYTIGEMSRRRSCTTTKAWAARDTTSLRKCASTTYREGVIDLGTNIYLKRKKPRMVPVYDETHVCKLSGGWRVHFDGSSAAGNTWEPERDKEAPRIGSMDDLRGYLSTGDWELVDEYGEKTTLEEVLEHDEYRRDGELWNTRVSLDDYYDREGYPWSRREFC